MGFLTDFLDRGAKADAAAVWRELFPGTDKERERPLPQRERAGSRSLATNDASLKRLLQAFRSNAPGGWTDDRYEQSRHFVGIQYICIHRTGEQLSEAEFQVFHRDDQHPDGKRPVKRDDPPEGGRLVRPYDLVELLQKPNPDDSFGDLLYAMNQQLDLTGMALTWLVPNKLGTPYELYPIPTATAIPQPVLNPDYPKGYYRIQPLYPYGPFSTFPVPNSAVGAAIPAQWMLRVKYQHPLLRYEGYSPMTAMRLHIDEVEMVDRSRHSSMRRGVHPSAVLNFKDMDGAVPLPEPEILRIKADFEETQMGPENFGKLMVTTPGASLEEFGQKPVDMDYQAGWEQLCSFVMAGFGITKPVAGMIDDAAYATLFAALKQLNLLTLSPKSKRIADKITRHVGPFFGDDLIVEIRCKRIDDHDVTRAMVDSMVAASCITKNEVRKAYDQPLTTESWGEEIAGPMEKDPTQPPATELNKEGPASAPQRGELLPLDGREESPFTVRQRPKPRKLGAGSLGPRKQLKHLTKALSTGSFYDQVQEACRNGHG